MIRALFLAVLCLAGCRTAKQHTTFQRDSSSIQLQRIETTWDREILTQWEIPAIAFRPSSETPAQIDCTDYRDRVIIVRQYVRDKGTEATQENHEASVTIQEETTHKETTGKGSANILLGVCLTLLLIAIAQGLYIYLRR